MIKYAVYSRVNLICLAGDAVKSIPPLNKEYLKKFLDVLPNTDVTSTVSADYIIFRYVMISSNKLKKKTLRVKEVY